MKKFISFIIVFTSIGLYAQPNSQDMNLTPVNTSYNKIHQTNKTCISMLEELDKMKSYIKEQPPVTVDFVKNKETYIRMASEWIKVCGIERK